MARALGVAAPAPARAAPAVKNPLDITFPPSVDGAAVPYVIVTSQALSPSFQPLATWKTRRGRNAAVVTREWIATHYPNGADPAEQLRFFLSDAYANWGTMWVLLGGDTDVVPTRFAVSTLFASPEDPELIPSDLYFACLDGNWNADRDDRTGEALVDGVDLLPELFVGRAPVSTPAEATVFVQRTLAHEQTPPVNGLYPSSIVFMAEDLGFMDGAVIAQEAYGLVYPWMRRVRMYESFASYPGSVPLTKVAALDSLDSGFGWFHHVGHGFRNTMSVGNGSINNSDADGLTNGNRRSFTFAINCSSASIDFNSIGERFLKNANGGSVGYVGTTRIAFPQVSRRYQNEFYRLAFADSIGTAGECLFMCRLPWVSSSNTDNADRWTQFALILLGDPDLPLWTHRPEPLVGQHAATLTLGTGTYPVTALTDGTPVPGARVTLWASGQDHQTGLTGPVGSVNLPFDPETEGTFLTTITARNRLPYLGQAQTVAGGAPFLSIFATVLDDDAVDGTIGNGDGEAGAGETVGIQVILRNSGQSAATGVTGTLQVESGAQYLSIQSGSVSYGTIPADGSSPGASAHLVRLEPNPPPGFLPRFRLDATSDQGSWSDIFVLPVHTMRIEHYDHLADDAMPNGNGNGIIEAGETIDYVVTVRNVGDGEAVGVEAELRVLNVLTGQPDPDVQVTDGTASYGDLDPLERASGAFAFALSGAAVPAELRIELTVEDAYDTLLLTRSDVAAPATVDSLRAIGSDDAIRLLWAPSPSPDVLGYDISRSTSPSGPFARVNLFTVAGASFYEDGPLPPMSRFYYKIAARDSSANTSAPSETISASTNPPLASGWPIETTQVTTSGPQIYDFDQDGSRELVMGSDYIYAWRANGNEVLDGDNDPRTSGPFSTSGFDATVGFRSDAAITNLDGIGSYEIIMAGWGGTAGQGYVHVLGPDGNPRPGWPRTLTFPFNWGSAAVGHIDADDKLEIVVMQAQNGVLYVFNHDGTEVLNGDNNPNTIGPFFQTNSTFNYASPALGNFDQDPRDEIVVVTNSVAGQVFVIDGNGTPLAGWPQSTGGQITSSPAIADLDGVFPPEIVVAAEDDSVYVFRGNGGRYPGWPKRADVFTTDARTASPVVVDLDLNGQLDILFPDTDGVFHAWRRDGTVLPGWSNVLFAQDALESGATQATPTVGDVDGDGQLEVLLGAENGKLYGWNHNGTELAGFPIQLEGEVRSGATLADFDDDGLVEIAVSGWDQNVYVWDMPGAFVPERMPWPSFRHDIRNTGNAATTTVIGVEPPLSPDIARFRLGPVIPNPFRAAGGLTPVEVGLDVPAQSAAAVVSLRIYDVAGRLARLVHEGPLAAGHYRFRWDGRDTAGRLLPAGVYFLAAEGPGFDASEKLVLVR